VLHKWHSTFEGLLGAFQDRTESPNYLKKHNLFEIKENDMVVTSELVTLP
jgi:hypothetical protein